MLPIAACKQ